jgi:hypothetical protein
MCYTEAPQRSRPSCGRHQGGPSLVVGPPCPSSARHPSARVILPSWPAPSQPLKARVVFYKYWCSPGQGVLAEEVLNGTKVVRQLFGEGQGVTDQPGYPLAQRLVEALNRMSFAGFVGDGLVLHHRNDSWIDEILGLQALLAVFLR